jgi:hypothetical protein
MYSVRRSLNAACACRLRCLRSSAVEWTCTVLVSAKHFAQTYSDTYRLLDTLTR